jgi:hypothetical protein
MEIKKNEASWDRIARIALGVAAVGVAVAGLSPWGWLGLILIITGALGWCPIYWACRIKTTR